MSSTERKIKTVTYTHQGKVCYFTGMISPTTTIYYSAFPPEVGPDGFIWKLEAVKENGPKVFLRLSCHQKSSSQNLGYWCELTINGNSMYKGMLIGVEANKQLVETAKWSIGDGEVSFSCEISIFEIIKSVAKVADNECSCAAVSEMEFSLNSDFEKLLDDVEDTDVIFKVGDQELPAHKFVLSARSAVFKAMFKHANTKESQNNCVEIEDTDPDTMKIFLRFLYSDKLPPNVDDLALRNLLLLSDKYGVMKLKNLVEAELIKLLVLETVVEILVLAHLHSTAKLKQAAVELISNNYSQIVKQEEWKEVRAKYPNLMEEVMIVMSEKFSKM